MDWSFSPVGSICARAFKFPRIANRLVDALAVAQASFFREPLLEPGLRLSKLSLRVRGVEIVKVLTFTEEKREAYRTQCEQSLFLELSVVVDSRAIGVWVLSPKFFESRLPRWLFGCRRLREASANAIPGVLEDFGESFFSKR